MSDDPPLETVEIEQLEQDDIENILREVDIMDLLNRTKLETVLGGFGAVAGSTLGALIGRKLSALLDSSENDPGDEPAGDKSDEQSAEGEHDQSDGDAGKPETREELEERSYRELQSLASETDVKGNLSQDEMTEQLAEELGIDNE